MISNTKVSSDGECSDVISSAATQSNGESIPSASSAYGGTVKGATSDPMSTESTANTKYLLSSQYPDTSYLNDDLREKLTRLLRLMSPGEKSLFSPKRNCNPSSEDRKCWSCHITKTDCWRLYSRKRFCNSCGTRYRTEPRPRVNSRYGKCGIICTNQKCRYVPTKGNIRTSGRKYCHYCKGKEIIVDEQKFANIWKSAGR